MLRHCIERLPYVLHPERMISFSICKRVTYELDLYSCITIGLCLICKILLIFED